MNTLFMWATFNFASDATGSYKYTYKFLFGEWEAGLSNFAD